MAHGDAWTSLKNETDRLKNSNYFIRGSLSPGKGVTTTYRRADFSNTRTNINEKANRDELMRVTDKKRDQTELPLREFDNVGGRKDAYRMLVKQINWELTQFERKKKYYSDIIDTQNKEIAELEKELYNREISATYFNAKNYSNFQPNQFSNVNFESNISQPNRDMYAKSQDTAGFYKSNHQSFGNFNNDQQKSTNVMDHFYQAQNPNNPYSKLEQSLAECKALSEGLKAITTKKNEAYSKYASNLMQSDMNPALISSNLNYSHNLPGNCPLKNSALMASNNKARLLSANLEPSPDKVSNYKYSGILQSNTNDLVLEGKYQDNSKIKRKITNHSYNSPDSTISKSRGRPSKMSLENASRLSREKYTNRSMSRQNTRNNGKVSFMASEETLSNRDRLIDPRLNDAYSGLISKSKKSNTLNSFSKKTGDRKKKTVKKRGGGVV